MITANGTTVWPRLGSLDDGMILVDVPTSCQDIDRGVVQLVAVGMGQLGRRHG